MGNRLESSDYLMTLKRKHKVVIRDLSKSMGITLIRIRYVLANGVSNHYELRDWVQGITGSDPGNMENFPVKYRDSKRTLSAFYAK